MQTNLHRRSDSRPSFRRAWLATQIVYLERKVYEARDIDARFSRILGARRTAAGLQQSQDIIRYFESELARAAAEFDSLARVSSLAIAPRRIRPHRACLRVTTRPRARQRRSHSSARRTRPTSLGDPDGEPARARTADRANGGAL